MSSLWSGVSKTLLVGLGCLVAARPSRRKSRPACRSGASICRWSGGNTPRFATIFIEGLCLSVIFACESVSLCLCGFVTDTLSHRQNARALFTRLCAGERRTREPLQRRRVADNHGRHSESGAQRRLNDTFVDSTVAVYVADVVHCHPLAVFSVLPFAPNETVCSQVTKFWAHVPSPSRSRNPAWNPRLIFTKKQEHKTYN